MYVCAHVGSYLCYLFPDPCVYADVQLCVFSGVCVCVCVCLCVGWSVHACKMCVASAADPESIQLAPAAGLQTGEGGPGGGIHG